MSIAELFDRLGFIVYTNTKNCYIKICDKL